MIDGYVLAAKTAGKWRGVERGQGRWKDLPASTFREIGLGPVGGSVKARFDEEDVPQGVYLRQSGIAPDGVYVGGVTPRALRKVVDYSLRSPIYLKALGGFLSRSGLKGATPRITRVVGVDLDGDGTREVLIEARNREGLGMESLNARFGPRDYSVVLLRSIRGGKVVDQPLGFATARNGDGLVRTLRAVADLDGDGRMEVVTSYVAWEAFGGALWSYRAGKATRLVQNGSGV